MWKPVLSAANQVRILFMPPKARTATRPSGCRLHGHPQCSSCSSSRGASLHERLDRVLVAQPVAPGDRVVGVLVEGVALRDHPGRAALGRHGVAAHRVDLRHDGHVESRRRSRRWRWQPAGRRRRHRPGARRGRRLRGHHSPRSSSSTSTLPWWSTIMPVDAAVVVLLAVALASAGVGHVLGDESLQILGRRSLTVVQVPARRER